MPRPKTLPETGSLVTVTITDRDDVTHTFHGTLHEHVGMRVLTNDDPTAQIQFSHQPVPLLAGEMWVRIYSATGNPFHPGDLAPLGREWCMSGMYDFYVSTEATNVTIRRVTKDGKKWIDANLSLDSQRARIVEQIKALDPKLAAAADNLFGEVEHDAFQRGKDEEFRNANGW
jgi:hypothetical protein